MNMATTQGRIRIALVGMGNCAASLMQGIHYYSVGSGTSTAGLMHEKIGPYAPGDVEVVAAWDVDRRKVGIDAARAVFAPPNCTSVICNELPDSGVTVRMGRVLDGFSEHMRDFPERQTFVQADAPEPTDDDVVDALRQSDVQIVLNYLPVGSEEATRFYADCALRAGAAFVNNIPVFLASDPDWARRFREAGLPIFGDDIKAQVGATIVHRALMHLFASRGAEVERTYQLNTGGNTDFLNMLNRDRLESKRRSKTEAVQAAAARRVADDDIHVGPSDHVPWLGDTKVCHLRIEGKLFGGAPVDVELRLSVADSPNSAGVAIDAIRCCKLALDRGIGGPIEGPCAFMFKHPPRQMADHVALEATEQFIAGE